MDESNIKERLSAIDIELKIYCGKLAPSFLECVNGHEFLASPGHILYLGSCPHCDWYLSNNHLKDAWGDYRKLRRRNEKQEQKKKEREQREKRRQATRRAVAKLPKAPEPPKHPNKRLTPNEAQAKVKVAGITIRSEYTHSKKKVLAGCICGHEWWVKPYHLFNGSGCPKCFVKNLPKRQQLPHEEITAKLAIKNAILIGEYKTHQTKTQFKCVNGHEWESTVYDICRLRRGIACPICSKYKKAA